MTRDGVQNTYQWSGRTETKWRKPNWIMSSLQQPFVGGVVDKSRLVMPVLYTFSSTIPFPHVAGLKYGESGRHSWGGINIRVTYSDNSVAALAWWVFQVSQRSVETLFRWGGKRSSLFAANLCRKLSTKFHQNCLGFIQDITEKHVGLFSDTVYIFDIEASLVYMAPAGVVQRL